MTTSPEPAVPTVVEETPVVVEVPLRSDVGNWASHAAGPLAVAGNADVAWGIAGRRLTGPMQGFGRLWQRTYTLTIGEVATPQQVIATWRAHFGEFWPGKSRFYGAIEGINPGDVAPIAMAAAGGMTLATGVMVLYADDESFSFMTPEGHMFGGMVTFSAAETDGGTVIQTQVLIRANDPLFEVMMPLIKIMEDRFWGQTMNNLAVRMGATAGDVEVVTVLVDRKRLWHNASNVRYNGAIRSMLHIVATPVALVRRRLGRATS